MGIPFVTLFGDKTEDELRKELEEVNAEITKLTSEKEDLVKALEKYDSSTEG